MKLFDVTGKRAFVTGSGSGIGLGLAKGLLDEGARVVLSSRSDSARIEAEKLRARGFEAHCVLGDMSREDETVRMYHEALGLLGGQLDILVNCAGAQHRAPSEKFPVEEFDRVMNVNIRNLFVLCQLAGNHMLERGYGKIVNIASMQSFFGVPLTPAYAASKGAVAQLTKVLGNEWIKRGVNVNAIAPGWIETKLIRALMDDEVRSREILGRLPAGRWGQPEDLVGALIFLSSAASDYLSGVILPVDGGYLTR